VDNGHRMEGQGQPARNPPPPASAPIRLDQFRSGAYSQHGEEGVIEAVFRAIGTKTKTCVEFGAYDLKKASNVYSLWTSGWRTLLLEPDWVKYAKLVRDYAAHPQASEQRLQIANRLVTEHGPDSLDSILAEYGFPKDLDLVSVDVDGTDYHLWRGLRSFEPRLVVVEYNPMIPPHLDIVGSGNGNHLGCSALSLMRLGREKGYSLVACIAWNAFFVRSEHAQLFVDADDLEALFDRSYLRYAIQSYQGEVFFSAPLPLRYKPFRRDSAAIESSSVEIGRLGDTLGRVVKLGLLHYLLAAESACVAALQRMLPPGVYRALRRARWAVVGMLGGSR
jgi:hypothetical protein